MAEEPGSADDATAARLATALASAEGRLLGQGYQASVHLFSTPYGDLVLKRPHAAGVLGGLWRFLLRREQRVYERLADIPGIPRCYGLVDGESLALEYVPGPSLREYEAQIVDREAFFAKLRTTLEAMHAAGVAHGDLKRKDNIVVGPDERPYLIDFGIACRRSNRSALWNGLAFETVKQMDYNAWIKLKYGKRVDPFDAAGLLSASDAALYRPLLIERLARAVRVPWQTLTLRRPRQRWRARRKRD